MDDQRNEILMCTVKQLVKVLLILVLRIVKEQRQTTRNTTSCNPGDPSEISLQFSFPEPRSHIRRSNSFMSGHVPNSPGTLQLSCRAVKP
jgi:hypothetical protein